MADDQDSRTEDPTGKRQGQAREQGQVGMSRDITAIVMFAASTLVVLTILPWSMQPLFRLMRHYIEHADGFDFSVPLSTGKLAGDVSMTVALALGLPMAVLILASVGSTIAQTGWLWATGKLKLHFDFLNPLVGIKRILSVRQLIEFAKALVKGTVIGTITYNVLAPDFDHARVMIGMPATMILNTMLDEFQRLMLTVMSAVAGIALLDYLYQKWSTLQQLKMTKQEVKDEHKNSEGDPHIKGQQRKRRNARARQRMLKEIPKASVVVTNPTHYAVALAYTMGGAGAPRVVAKGMDFLAAKIREIATANDVPIIENPPLARALYAAVELEDEIPPEHYKAVAEIIGYVMKLKRWKTG